MKAWLLLISLAACAKPAGGPLSHTFDNAKIASVPLESKQTVADAQQQHDVAQLRRTTAQSEYRDSEVEQDLAEFQADHSLVVSQIVARDLAKTATPTTESAALARRTAEAKVGFMRARRDWLEKLADSSLFAVYAAQGKLELERARIAQANNLTPPGFDLQPYQRQFEDRDAAAKRAAEVMEAQRKTKDGKLAAWIELEKSAMLAAGVTGPVESPRYMLEWNEPTTPKPVTAPVPTPATSQPPVLTPLPTNPPNP